MRILNLQSRDILNPWQRNSSGIRLAPASRGEANCRRGKGMGHKLNREKAQFSLEYAVLIVCIVGALIAMQVYVSRGIQGRHRQTADSIGNQYDPRDTNADFTETFTAGSNTTTNTTEINGTTISTTRADFFDAQTREGSETVGALP